MGDTAMDERSEALELYKVMVTTITANEQRRQQINSVFLSLIGVGAAAAAALSDQFDPIFVAIPGIFLSIVWWAQIRYLKRLAKAKWGVAIELERSFSAQPFTEEYKAFKKGIPGANLSDIESFVPALCFFISIGYTLRIVLM